MNAALLSLRPGRWYRLKGSAGASSFASSSSGIGNWLFSTTLTLLKAFAAPCVLSLACLYTVQRSILYPIPPEVVDPTATGGKVYEIEKKRYSEVCSDPVTVLHFQADDANTPTFVYFHGNGDQLGWGAADFGKNIALQGYSFYAMEYPGYGLSKSYGRPSERSLYEVSEKALKHLTASQAEGGLGVKPENVVLLGHSIGCGVAVEMALRGHGTRMILISPFTSVPAMARDLIGVIARLIPNFALNLMCRDYFDNAGKSAKIRLPTLIIHGETG